MMAIELYRVKKEIDALERKRELLRLDLPGREELEKELMEARVEHARLKKMLEGSLDR